MIVIGAHQYVDAAVVTSSVSSMDRAYHVLPLE